MSAKHRLTRPAQRSQSRSNSGLLGVGSVSLLCVVGLAGLLGASHETDHGTAATAVTIGTPSQEHQVSQEGTLIAVSTDSVTARSANGYTQTYLLTPETAVIARRGGEPAGAASYFTVNDEVAIVGTVRNGTVLATAVAQRDVAHGDGPPMDFGAESGGF